MPLSSVVYRDADELLRARKKISQIAIPYDQYFERSNFKTAVILLITLVAPIPGIRYIYMLNEPHIALLLLQYCEMALVTLTGFFSYLWTSMKVKSLKKIHKSILLTHEVFKVFQKRPLMYNIKWMVTYDVLVVVMVLVHFGSGFIYPVVYQRRTTSLFNILASLSYVVPSALVHCLGSFFRTSLFALDVQLTHLNRLLKSVGILKTAHIETLVYIHCLISYTFKELNSAQTLPVFFLSSCTFFVVVYNLYDMLTFNLEESLNNTLGDNIGGAAWLAFWTTQLVVLVILIENVVDKHDEFSCRLHYMIIQDPTCKLSKSVIDRMSPQDRLMAHLAVQHRLEYSAAGFYTVSYKLISSIASSATTYLIILVQFAQINVGSQKVPGGENKTSSSTYLGSPSELFTL